MTQRVRNIQIALGSNMPSSDAVAIQEAYGFNMGAYKKATQTVSASTTLVNDDTLWTELKGAGQHYIHFYIPTTVTAAGGVKLQMVADQGLTINAINLQVVYGLTATAPVISSITALATPVNGGTTNAYTYVEIFGTVDVANQGVLQLQWAQQAASGSTAFLVGSKIQAFQITGP
jgi:hypothetical protein